MADDCTAQGTCICQRASRNNSYLAWISTA